MILRLKSETDVDNVVNDMQNCYPPSLHEDQHRNIGGVDLEHYRDMYKGFIRDDSLTEGTKILAGKNPDTGIFDSVLIFDISRKGMYNSKLAARELAWLSFDSTSSAAKNALKMFRMAHEIIDELGCEYSTFSTYIGSGKSEKVEEFYGKKGYVLESKTYIKIK